MTIVNSEISITPKSPAKDKHKLLQKVFLIYTLVILFVLCVAILNLVCHSVMKKILRDDVGVVAFVCFVSIQGSLELEDKDKVKEDDSEFKLKFGIYIIDLCLCINGRVRPVLVIFGCAFSLLQLALVYFRVTKSKLQQSKQSSGMALISANVMALGFVIGKDFLPSNIALDFAKIVLIGGVIMFYVNIILADRLNDFMQKPMDVDDENVLFIGFKIIKPLVSTVVGKLKKLNRIKAK